MIYRVEDPVRDAELFIDDKESDDVARCDQCGTEIPEYGWRINGALYCEDCLNKYWREWI